MNGGCQHVVRASWNPEQKGSLVKSNTRLTIIKYFTWRPSFHQTVELSVCLKISPFLSHTFCQSGETLCPVLLSHPATGSSVHTVTDQLQWPSEHPSWEGRARSAALPLLVHRWVSVSRICFWSHCQPAWKLPQRLPCLLWQELAAKIGTPDSVSTRSVLTYTEAFPS